MATDSINEAARVVKKTANNDPQGAAVRRDESGKTIIRNQVVSKIAGLAIREVDGVRELVPFGAGQSMERIAKTLSGGAMTDIGVHVEVGEVEAAIDCRIITDYGASIPAITEAIRRNVSERVSSMTGLRVVQVNVDVVDLYFPEDEAADEYRLEE